MPDRNPDRRIRVRDIDDESFWVGESNDHWPFYGSKSRHGGVRVKAGCRNLSLKQARKHWSEPRYTKVVRYQYAICDGDIKRAHIAKASRRIKWINRAIDAIEAEAVKRGWLRKPAKPKAKKAVKRKAAKKPRKTVKKITPLSYYVIYDRFGYRVS